MLKWIQNSCASLLALTTPKKSRLIPKKSRLIVGERLVMLWDTRDETRGVDEWDVLDFGDTFIRIWVVRCSPRIGTYLDVGAQYTLRKVFDMGGMQTWEIPAAQMKRSTSQLLLEIQDGRVVGLDLDM